MSFHVVDEDLPLAPTVETVMHGNLPLVPHDSLMADVIPDMARFGCVGVIDDLTQLIGVITDGDLRRYARRHDDLSRQKAKDVMTWRPLTVRRDAPLPWALNVMKQHRITALFVEENHKAVGIVQMHDCLP